MKTIHITLLSVITLITSCIVKSDLDDKKLTNQDLASQTCSNVNFPDWETSQFVLPYSVGEQYPIGLNACSTLYHAAGEPDQFAIDFDMPIGSIIRASLEGKVVHVEERGGDFGFPNNLVVVKKDNLFVQYMHLTKDGAVVEVGDSVAKGDIIGYSGASGLAGYPHLHFVVTFKGWAYPYTSVPVTFSNTSPNPNSLMSGESYLAQSY